MVAAVCRRMCVREGLKQLACRGQVFSAVPGGLCRGQRGAQKGFEHERVMINSGFIGEGLEQGTR